MTPMACRATPEAPVPAPASIALIIDVAGFEGWRENERERFADGIDEATAEDLLRRDVEAAVRAVLRLIRVPLADGPFDALCSFTFNLGAGALQRSTLRRKINREEHDAVPAEFRRWVWAGGRKLKGLIRRREAEAVLYDG